MLHKITTILKQNYLELAVCNAAIFKPWPLLCGLDI